MWGDSDYGGMPPRGTELTEVRDVRMHMVLVRDVHMHTVLVCVTLLPIAL